MDRLKWDKLLSERRERISNAKTRENTSDIVARNQFEADYDRIVGASFVRRLQDKAQVFPLQQNDIIRTRLTHSIEVSAMARSLGKAVGKQLEYKNIDDFDSDMTEKLAALLQTAGLIHDVGNPPFGHYGETVIKEWFQEWFACDGKNVEGVNKLTVQEKNDFLFFDGNVQNIRIITKLQTQNDIYGANFTYATINTLIKYPHKSDVKNIKELKKFGFFKSEEDIIEKVLSETGLNLGQRHPATYLLEAADDIIYICDDIEDGVKKGCIHWSTVYQEIKNEFGDKYKEIFDNIEKREPDKYMDSNEKEQARVRNFRNFVQGYLFKCAVNEFIVNYDAIMTNTYKEKELLTCEKELISYLKNEVTAKYCFSAQEVLKLEVVGDEVIRTLLNTFIPTLIKNKSILMDTSRYPGKIYRMISPNFRYVARYDYKTKKYGNVSDIGTYEMIHLALDFISGMTDSYAVNIYKSLKGISFQY